MTTFRKGDRVRVRVPRSPLIKDPRLEFLEFYRGILATVTKKGMPVFYMGGTTHNGVQVEFDHSPFPGGTSRSLKYASFYPEHLQLVTRQYDKPTWGGMRWHEGRFIPKVRKSKYSSKWDVVYAVSPQCTYEDSFDSWHAAMHYATHLEG